MFFQGLVLTIGLLSNSIAAVTLQLHNDGFPAVTKVLYQHQACLDALICLMGIVMVLQPCMGGSNTGNPTIDHILCQVWHGQAFYWTWVLISNWNIVYISFERFGMIHYPMRHRNTQVKYLCRGFCIIYAVSFFSLIPAYFQVMYREEKGKCLDEYYWKHDEFCNVMTFFGGYWFFISYALPIVIFISLYVLTVCNIRSRQKQQDNTRQKEVFRKADEYITRTAVAITICFVISQSLDAWSYLLSRTNITQGYAKNSPMQTTWMFFATLNSCINPMIYCVSLKAFRASLRKTFRRGVLKKYIDAPTAFDSISGAKKNQSNDDSRRMIGSQSRP